ncbi:MAG TPA: SRPBCC family protein [Arenimonas sp.]|uniref:SRPBCC family protein n=1 Tax=Arenimonas sp. TaxID=1872635 RepID=UPI002D1DA395|nr:SRPBCC family protein [Arenimonas sp.]HMB56039.1 SRPBCC family protein [Arenimonas sp.]
MTDRTPIQVELEHTAKAPVDLVFKVIVAMDVSLFLTGYGWLPAATHVSRQTGPWSVPGSTRTAHFSDGNSAFEELLVAEAPTYLRYRISRFTSFMRFLASEIQGEWRFVGEQGGTRITWLYSFTPRSTLAALVLRRLMRGSWLLYMRQSLDRAARYAEANAHLHASQPR